MLPRLEKGIETSIIVNNIGVSTGASGIVLYPTKIIVEVGGAGLFSWSLLAELRVV